MISKGTYVTRLGEGDRVKAVFMVVERKLLTARSGKPYAKMRLADKTGEIPAIMWDNAREQMDEIEPGSVAGVRGVVESFNNIPQIRVEKIVYLKDEDIDIADLVPTASRDRGSMMDEFDSLVGTIKEKYLGLLITEMFSPSMRKAFMKAPAAKGIHHNYVGGLLEHTLYMLKAIDALYPVYAHLGMNRDLVMAGAVFHDIGKIFEYTSDRIIEMTPMGRLVGHVYLSARMVEEKADHIEGFPQELRMQLVHLILSHHGQMEFGSPKLPLTRDAIFLHMVDDLDAKLTGFSSIIDATPEEDDFSAFSRVYERYLYTRVYEGEK